MNQNATPTVNTFLSGLNLSSSDQLTLQDVFSTFEHAIDLNPADPDAYMQLGLSLDCKCYPESAITAYNQAIILRPNHMMQLYHLGNALCKMSRYDEAINTYKNAIDHDSLSATPHVGLAFVFYLTSRTREAIEETQRALQLDPNLYSAHILQGTILRFRRGNVLTSKENVEVVNKSWSLLQDMYTTLGVSLYDMGRITEAVKMYEAQLTLTFDFKWLFLYFLVSSKAKKENDELLSLGIKICEIALASEPRNMYAYFAMICLFLKKKDNRALEMAEKAVKINPRHDEALFWLAEAFEAQKINEKAIETYKAAILINSRSLDALNNYAFLLEDLGRAIEAIDIYEALIKMDSQASMVFNNIGWSLQKVGRLDEAIQMYRTAIQIDPQCAIAFRNLARALLDSGRTDEANVAYRIGIENDPENSMALNSFGVTLYKQGRLEDAIKVLSNATQVDPQCAVGYYNLGMIYERLNRTDEAIEAFWATINLEPSKLVAYKQLGAVLVKTNQLKEAVAVLRQAVKCNPTAPSCYEQLAETLMMFPSKQKEASKILLQAIKLNPVPVSGISSAKLALLAAEKRSNISSNNYDSVC